MKEPVLIYDKVKAVMAVKGKKSRFPGQLFKHDFKESPRMFGLPNGDILITSRKKV